MNMKIEKINENQIRCTLTRADLAARELRLSELAYGTEKAKSLFHDMMQQAAAEFGFEAEDIPLMIEAIPATSDSIVLIISKVEDPDDLDSRFSKLAPFLNNPEDDDMDFDFPKLEGAEEAPSPLRLFSFATMDSVITAAKLLDGIYFGFNTLYKDHGVGLYLLLLTRSEHSTKDFNRICNMLSEYGSLESVPGASIAFLEEHCEIIIPSDAVQQLAAL